MWKDFFLYICDINHVKLNKSLTKGRSNLTLEIRLNFQTNSLDPIVFVAYQSFYKLFS